MTSIDRKFGRDPNLPTLVALASLGSWEWDLANGSMTWSEELSELFGLSAGERPRSFFEYLDHVDEDQRGAAHAAIRHALAGKNPFDCVQRRTRPDGGEVWIRSRGRIVCEGQASRVVGICDDVTAQKEAEAELVRLAFKDPLTDLGNRTLFADRLSTALSRLQRRAEILAVMFLDLDHFKRVNDKCGHGGGDEVLKEVAQRLVAAVRPHDIVARFGGDEFAILCEDLAGQPDAEGLARRVLEALQYPVVVGNRTISVTTSIGITLCCRGVGDTGEHDADSLLAEADAAMYQAKAAGRNGYYVLDDLGREQALERVRVGDDLAMAIARSDLRVHYQPDVDLSTEAIVGVEALVRWAHPERGVLEPSEFINVAEEAGAIAALGEWVLRESCRQLAAWDAEGIGPLSLSVNLSALQLRQPSLIDAIQSSLTFNGITPSRLCLEVTETVLMDDVELSIEALLGLRKLGVRVAIDDFGTGYSSLSYLRRFPVDVVKVDQSFVAGLGVDPAAEAIVAAVVNLSHALGLAVVAEGVETADQLLGVRALACDRAQGFYWARPMAPEELSAWTRGPRTRSDLDEPLDIGRLLTERAEALRAATGRPVVVQSPPKMGTVVADQRSLRTVLDHLLGNAVTFSREGQPIVLSGATDRRWARISVTDYGCGMSREDAARCFEAFWQAKNGARSGSGGTGMGLFIVRTLVEAMGGHVGVKSARGKGSTFTVALPRSSRGQARSRPADGLPGVSEDSTIREFMRQIGVPNRRGS